MLFTPAAGSDFKLITVADCAGAATVDFTSGFDGSLYRALMFDLSNLLPATDNVHLYVRTSADGGATFDAGASDYCATGAATAQTTVAIGVSNLAAEGGVCGMLMLSDPANAASAKSISGFGGSANAVTATTQDLVQVRARRNAAAAVNGVRFFWSAGNFAAGTAGTIRLYGLRKV